MAKTILIFGESGSGKTTSCRNLDPKTTFYIDCDKKGLSWKGWREQYNSNNKNYMITSDAEKINKILQKIDTTQPHIKTIIIDTINGIMVDDELQRAREKGYDKWLDLAISVYGTVDMSNTMRDDLYIFFMGHCQTERDDSGYSFTRLKTSGRKLDKIVLESKFTTVLYAKNKDGKYVFETQASNSTAKSPMGAFPEFEIENDLKIVIEALKEY